MRKRLAARLHAWAGRLHPDYDFRHASPYGLAHDPDGGYGGHGGDDGGGTGLVVLEGQGLPIWYRNSEHEKIYCLLNVAQQWEIQVAEEEMKNEGEERGDGDDNH